MLKKHVVYIMLFFASCVRTNDSTSIYSEIERKYNECGNNPCYYDFKEDLSFDWDKAFVFSYLVKPEDINKQLGFTYPYYKEFSEKIVFLKENRIVFHQEEPIIFEGIDPTAGGLLVNFPFDADVDYFYFEKNNSKFLIVKDDKFNCFYLKR